MLHTAKQIQSPDILRNARIAVGIIQRLGRGNHISITIVENTGVVDTIRVDEIGQQVLASLGIKTEITGLRGSAKHLYQVKLGPVYNRDGSRVTDSFQAVLVNTTYFNQALATVRMPHAETAQSLQVATA